MKKYTLAFFISLITGLAITLFVLSQNFIEAQGVSQWIPYLAAPLFGLAGVLGLFFARNGEVIFGNLTSRLDRGPYFWRMLIGIGIALAVPAFIRSYATDQPSAEPWFWIRTAQIVLILLSVLIFLIRKRVALIEKDSGSQDRKF